MTYFDRTTAIEARGDGQYRAHIDPGWRVLVGPNGGYIAAIALRALTDAAGDPDRAPRTVTVHYLSPPEEGPLDISTSIDRAGRSISTVSARFEQQGRLTGVARATFAKAREGLELTPGAAPAVPPPGACEAREWMPGAPPFFDRYEFRHALGGRPFSGGSDTTTAGWMRLVDDRPLDALLVAALADAWFPSVAVVLDEPTAAPTLDLTIHFAWPLPPVGWSPGAWVLGIFRAPAASGGLFEEDGELWTEDGRLVARSRQLAMLARPRPGEQRRGYENL